MELHPAGSRPTRRSPAERFTGVVMADEVGAMDNVSAGVVTFEPGARTAWHVHPGGQIIHALHGHGRVQADGGDVHQLAPGDTAVCPPGERHWHGAGPDRLFVQLAVQGPGPTGRAGAAWFEHVTDDEYARSPVHGPGGHAH
jgi:quercetin dioxygenase-like cupin family protein